jgi:hypothetical protein
MDLTVKIPERFKQDLDDRFNPKNAQMNKKCYNIDIRCPLCREYLSCKECVFKKYEKTILLGCENWIDNVMKGCKISKIIGMGSMFIYWDIENDKQARKQLKELRAKAKELITFY